MHEGSTSSAPMGGETNLQPPPNVPNIPRPPTRRARRRSWNELPVRLWAILTLIIGAIAIYITISRVDEAIRDRSLIEHGLDVNARIVAAMGSDVTKRWPRNDQVPVRLRFTLPGGKTHEMDTVLPAKPDAYAQPGTDIKIKIDPDDPDRWTEQTQPLPWASELTAPGMLIPLALALAIVTFIRRASVLNIWKNAPLAAATVVGTQQTALAPFSRVVRFTLREGEDRRIWNVLLPVRRRGIPQPGETIWLAHPPSNPARAIVAELYVDEP
ncbi:MAG TPA: hypothetical protein VH518_00745 [Tepidisphaeraceae bacterium]|jgi:hypothetical protein